MSDELSEKELRGKAEAYLKSHYGEDTVRMDIVSNGVKGGSGVLHVDITVSVGGARSNWLKWFTFKGGDVASMRWEMK